MAAAAAAADVPYSVQLDPDTARNLATNGATILILGVPLGTPIGLDQQVFLTGPRFKGVKMLPPGTHLLSYQATSADGKTLSPPVSTLLSLKPRQVLVRRWDAASEGLTPLEDEDEESRYADGVRRFDFDSELAPYDLGRYSQWASLTCYITEQLLDQLLPADREISIMAEAVDPQLMAPSTAAEHRLQKQLEEGRARLQSAMLVDKPEAEDDQQQQQQQQQDQQQQQQDQQQQQQQAAGARCKGGRCQYSQLPHLVKVPGATAAELTALNMDKTSLLEQLISRYSSSSSSSSSQPPHALSQAAAAAAGGGGAAAGGTATAAAAGAAAGGFEGCEILGELQFSFVAFVFGQSLHGYMHWKQLLVLLLGCVKGPLETHIQLFVSFLEAVTSQLKLGLAITPPSGGGGGNRTELQREQDWEEAAAAAAGAGGVVGGLVDELLPDSFLRAAFRGFFEMLEEEGAQAPAALLARAGVLESVLAVGLGWDFRLQELKLGSDEEYDEDDDRPVVVELTEQQQTALGLTS